MGQLILMRHGRSAWNKQNLFTGWVDIPLDEEGVRESIEGGKLIQDKAIDRIYTSTLVRSHMTLCLALMRHSSGKVPVFQHEGRLQEWGKICSPEAKEKTVPVYMAWQLNERMYGDLQGMNKAQMGEKYGAEQVKIWRRSFDVPPPHGESLEMTAARTLPYFQQEIMKHIEKGESVFICAHGNSLRSIVMFLDGLSPEEVVHLELATGAPLLYGYRDGKWTKRSLS